MFVSSLLVTAIRMSASFAPASLKTDGSLPSPSIVAMSSSSEILLNFSPSLFITTTSIPS